MGRVYKLEGGGEDGAGEKSEEGCQGLFRAMEGRIEGEDTEVWQRGQQ